MRSTRVSFGWVLIASFLLLCGCSEEDLGTEYTNQVPETVLSNAPPQGSVGSFLVNMNWYGSDPDGEVSGYYFAWDDTGSWFYTPSTGSTFVVSANECVQCDHTDTLYFAVHTFWVKAVDERGAHDPTPAHRTFTAESTAPITTITRGPCERNYCGPTGKNVLYEWTSFDPDGGEIDSFYYKMNLSEGLAEVVDETWTRVGSDCSYVRFADVEAIYRDTGRFNSFAVLAKDNAGSLERVLVHGQNWCCFDPMTGTETGIIINGGILGTRNNRADAGPSNIKAVSEIFRGVEISFRWEGNASHYGGNVVGYRYAVEDTTVWSTWYIDNTEYPADGGTFLPTVGNHVLYVQTLDDLGTVSLCYFKYYVEAGPVVGTSQAMLVVDDSEFSGLPVRLGSWLPHEADEREAEFFERIFSGYTITEFDCLDQGRIPPPVSLVGRFRNVFWYVDDYDETSNELQEIFRAGTRYLDSYVKVGGNLILSGYLPAHYLDGDCRFNFNYPFRYDEMFCDEGQQIPFSYSGLGLLELNLVGSDRFLGASSVYPAQYPSLPQGGAWPFPPGEDPISTVEAFAPNGINATVNAIPIYDFDYFVAAGEDSESVVSWRHCSLLVDNSDDVSTGSTAYFGWSLIWCDWDSVGGFMERFLTDVCNEPPTSP